MAFSRRNTLRVFLGLSPLKSARHLTPLLRLRLNIYGLADWQFGIAYNAVLKLCTILLYAEGWRPEKTLAHYRTLQALPLILGETRRDDADYLDTCRAKRNTAEYDAPGQVSAAQAKELAAFARELREAVVAWLGERHAGLCPWSGA